MARLFVSYSHADRASAERLLIHLKPLEDEGLIQIWYDRHIRAGADWLEEIQLALQRSDVGVVLVSANFLASEFCQKVEIAQLVERTRLDGLVLVPIVVDYCDWRSRPWLSRLQMLPPDGKPVVAQKPQSKAWTAVSRALRELFDSLPSARHPAPDRRASATRVESIFSLASALARLPRVDERIFGRDPELNFLSKSFAEPGTAGVCFVGFGGVGKSAIAWHWLTRNDLARHRFIACSFFSQGSERETTSEQFIVEALRALNDPAPLRGTLAARGERLARLVAAAPTILVLDGLEPLQFGPSSPGRSGEIRDPGLRGLLAELLANPGQSFFLVTTRVRLAGTSIATDALQQYELDVLPPPAARELLRAKGMLGTDGDLDTCSAYLGFHALALALAGEYAYTFCGGKVADITSIPLASVGVREGRHAKSIMEAYVVALGRDGAVLDLELLHLLGLFDRPAQWDWLMALRARPEIAGVTSKFSTASTQEVHESLSRLGQWKFVALRGLGRDSEVDTHPLVREHFGARLRDKNEDGWRTAQRRLFEYFRDNSEALPDSLEDMAVLFLCAIHGCRAGLYHETLHGVYFPRILRGDEEFAMHALEARESTLLVVRSFFASRSWTGEIATEPAIGQGLSESDKTIILLQAARLLASTRGYASPESETCYLRAEQQAPGDVEVAFSIVLGLWHAALARGNLTESATLSSRLDLMIEHQSFPVLSAVASRALATQYFYMGQFEDAVRHARAAIALLGDESSERIARKYLVDPVIACRAYEALALWHMGDVDEAMTSCQIAAIKATTIEHAHSRVVAMYLGAVLLAHKRDAVAAGACAERLAAVCEAEGFVLWLATARIIRGWATAVAGEVEVGLSQMQQAVIRWEGTGSSLFRVFWALLFADVLPPLGRSSDALHLVEKGLEICRQDVRWCEAELYRVKAELLARLAGDSREIEGCLLRSIEIARQRRAASQQLRSARDLCRHRLAEQGLDAQPLAWLQEACTRVACSRNNDTDEIDKSRLFLQQLECASGGV